MVKADFSRDYYGDLDLQPNADIAEIKKQFKKLALTYHPDRNPGRETEVTAKFQRIQSAHEVLCDPNERAKYDLNRITSKSNGKAGYQGASGVRGNPWANAGAQWAPPPKPPGANRRPPPSAGAARYGKFETPKTSASTAQEGAEARKKTYEAWESMRGQETRAQASANRGSYRPTPPSRDYTTPSGRDESNSYKHAPPPKTKPGFDEFRANYSPNLSPHRRAQSTGGTGRKGFTPATPGGDEPAAPKGAYFTQHKSQYAPEPPPRAPTTSFHNVQSDPSRQDVQPDPLRQFRQQVDPAANDTRQRTPYQTHGGEKLDPFDNANLNRSKSYRERYEKTGDPAQVPRTGSDPNLPQSHRARSFADHPTRPSKASFNEEAINSSSSDDGPQIKSPSSRKFAQPRRTPSGLSKDGLRMPETAEHSRKPSLSHFQRWYREITAAEPSLNGLPSGEPANGSGQANTQTTEESNMYGAPDFYSSTLNGRTAFCKFENYSESEVFDQVKKSYILPYWIKVAAEMNVSPRPMPTRGQFATYPSGVSVAGLNLFEAHQHWLVDDLINQRQGNCPYTRTSGNASISESDKTFTTDGRIATDPPLMGSPSKKQKFQGHSRSSPCVNHRFVQSFPIDTEKQKSNADNTYYPSSFSFKVDQNAFATTNTRRNGVASPSTENINTKFTPEEWEGKFEAGKDYFRPEQKASSVPVRSRAQSASRSRGRSPVKTRPLDPRPMQPQVEEEIPIESPGGTKFTPEEWNQTFKTQTFMPSQPATTAWSATSRKGRGPSLRPTMGGNAAVVDDSDNASEDLSLFTGRKNQTPNITASPALDPMEVDSTPPSGPASQPPKTPISNTVPLGMPSPGKRPAALSQSPIDSALKVDFDDLKVQDLMSTLNLPTAPNPPQCPLTPHSGPVNEGNDLYLEEFTNYMSDWDLFTNQFAFHMLARKKQNDDLGSMRWEDDRGLETYRKGLKEDKFVLAHWLTSQEKHDGALKEYAVWKERMKPGKGRQRPRKKTH